MTERAKREKALPPPSCSPFFDEGGITLYHGDCREILPQIAFDLVITDPPYNVGIDYGATTNDKMTPEEWRAWAEGWFLPCREIAETVLITGQARLPDYARIEPWKWLLAWHKPAAMGRSPVGFCNWEPIAMWGKGANNGVDFIRAAIKPDAAVDGHPCPKPLGWALGQISLFGDKVICDPFAGSGTTLRAAKDMGRKAIGIEVSEEYCEMIAQRMSQGVLNFEENGELWRGALATLSSSVWIAPFGFQT
jgi:site-specific DNA-methyltransferase (adenine-specific)